jgi:membrane protein
MALRRLLFLAGSLAAVAGFAHERISRWRLAPEEARRRGRNALSPMEMPWLGWRDALLRTWSEAQEDRLLSVSASVAFFALLSVVPGLSVLISVYGLITEPRQIATQLMPLLDVLPAAGRGLIEEQATRIASEPRRALSLNLFVSLGIALWSANAGIKAMFDGLNVIYDEREKRSFLRFNLTALGITVSAVLMLSALLFIVAVTPLLIRDLPFAPQIEFLLKLMRWPAFFLIAVVAIAILYWVGPSRRPARFVWVLPGAVVAAVLWAAASSLFAWYASTLGDYAATYGSLAAVVVFMTWLWLSATIVLLGAELNSELEHQTARDTTRGPEKPMGVRGARMADSVGPPVARG